jgi:phosphoenolpyruvate carboxykinase (ATP)
MPIEATRTMLRAALSGELDEVEYRTDELFRLEVPLHVAGVDDSLLHPRSTWRDPELYDVKARELAKMFAENFSKRFPDVGASIRAAGPNV